VRSRSGASRSAGLLHRSPRRIRARCINSADRPHLRGTHPPARNGPRRQGTQPTSSLATRAGVGACPLNRCRPLLDQESHTLLADFLVAPFDVKDLGRRGRILLAARTAPGPASVTCWAGCRGREACLELPGRCGTWSIRSGQHFNPRQVLCAPAAGPSGGRLHPRSSPSDEDSGKTPTLVTRVNEVTPARTPVGQPRGPSWG